MSSPGARLVEFVSGGQGGLSTEAQQGRRELLWISASVWIAPIVSAIHGVLAESYDAGGGFLVQSSIYNVVLFAALAQARPWARKLTIALLVPLSALSLIMPLVGDPMQRGVLANLLNGVVYGVSAFVLWRSTPIRAYMESQQGTVRFPKQGNMLAPGESTPRPPVARRESRG